MRKILAFSISMFFTLGIFLINPVDAFSISPGDGEVENGQTFQILAKEKTNTNGVVVILEVTDMTITSFASGGNGIVLGYCGDDAEENSSELFTESTICFAYAHIGSEELPEGTVLGFFNVEITGENPAIQVAPGSEYGDGETVPEETYSYTVAQEPEVPDVQASTVWRFFNTSVTSHFYTQDELEKNDLQANNPAWTFENPVFKAYKFNESTAQCEAGEPIFRMFNASSTKHFYTDSKEEYDYTALTNPNWRPEGVAYCAFQNQETDSVPMFQFYSDQFQGHFFTIDEIERDNTLQNPAWNKYEGIVFYVLPL